MLAAKEKTLSGGEVLPQAKTRVRGSALENRNGIGVLRPASSTLHWGWSPSYDGTASGELDQRYYNTGMGRYWSPDPGGIRTASPSRPSSWNRYTYVEGDPINSTDRHGLFMCVGCGGDEEPDDPCEDDPTMMGCAGYGGGGGGGYSPIGSGDQSSGGGAGYANLSLLNAIEGNLDAALSDPNCSKIFGSANLFGSGGPTAEDVLNSLITAANGGSGSPYGSIQFIEPGSGSVPAGILANTGASAVTIKNNLGFWHNLFNLSGPSTIYISTLDTNNSSFNSSSASAELTILHELGHLLSNLGWWGDQIKPDASNEKQSAKNDTTITNACGKDLNQ